MLGARQQFFYSTWKFIDSNDRPRGTRWYYVHEKVLCQNFISFCIGCVLTFFYFSLSAYTLVVYFIYFYLSTSGCYCLLPYYSSLEYLSYYPNFSHYNIFFWLRKKKECLFLGVVSLGKKNSKTVYIKNFVYGMHRWGRVRGIEKKDSQVQMFSFQKKKHDDEKDWF